MYEMDRDGFMLLAMGFNGLAAMKWRMRYIEAFSAMEDEFRTRTLAIDIHKPAQLWATLIEYSEKFDHCPVRTDQQLN